MCTFNVLYKLFNLIIDDAARLAKAYSVFPAGLLELGHFAKKVDARCLRFGIAERDPVSLQTLCNMYLDKPIKKELPHSASWKKDYLTNLERLCTSNNVQRVIVDAANDCYAAWKIFQKLETLRSILPGVELPPLIDYWEETVKKNRKRAVIMIKVLRDRLRSLQKKGRAASTILRELCDIVDMRIEGLSKDQHDSVSNEDMKNQGSP